MCADCGDLLCRAHVDARAGSGPWTFRARVGSQLAACTRCNRARFWRWVRGAGTLAGLGTGVMLWLESAPSAALIAVAGVVMWWLATTWLASRRSDAGSRG